MSLIDTLTKLEPAFREASNLAMKMQSSAKHHNKTETGLSMVDIVTEADLVVQEMLLKKMAQTELVNCRLLAEENTDSTSKFTGVNGYYLVIDPIDGTAIYSKGGRHFSTIISLHDGKNPLYTFMYYPALNWTHRILENNYFVSGQTPDYKIPKGTENYILYYSETNQPEKTIPELYSTLTKQGYRFVAARSFMEGYGISELLICNKIAGRYSENINVYDGLVSYHYALAKGLKIYSAGPDGQLDFNNIKQRPWGLYYPGYYLVLNHPSDHS